MSAHKPGDPTTINRLYGLKLTSGDLEAFFAERRKLGRGVGLDRTGRLVRAADLPADADH